MEWNTAKKIWQHSTDNHLFVLWEPFLETWPTAGIMQNGLVYELPTRERPITALESLLSPTLPTPRAQEPGSTSPGYGDSLNDFASRVSTGYAPKDLMATPTASQGQGGALGEEEARKRGNTVGIRDQAMDLAKLNGAKVSREELNVLPTPTTRDYKDGTAPHERDGVVQTDTISRLLFNSGEILLPTPTAVEGTKSMTYKNLDEKKGQTNLTNVVNTAAGVNAGNKGYLGLTDVQWGKFEPAIRRWEEVLGIPAPAPTKPDGKDGAHRLSSLFTEWLMGLEPGWITDVGLSRNDELKACGNGVVPQQAELALRILLDGVTIGGQNATN